MRKIFLPFTLVSLFTCAAMSTSLADMYTYKDGKGVMNMTNKLESVPAKYRSSMKVIKEEPKRPAASSQQIPPEPQPEAQASAPLGQATAAPASWREQLPKTAMILAAVAAGFWCLSRMTRLLPSRLLGKAIYVAFSLGVFLFLYQSYMRGMVERSQKLIQDASSVVKKANLRQQSKPAE